MEFVSPEGLRLDGRRPMEMRQIRAEIGAVAKADGSKIGLNKLMTKHWCAVSTACLILTIDRDIFGNSPDHGSLHIDTFDASVSDRYFCPSTSSRCGTRSACINAATLALVDAGIPMRDLVTSCISGYLNITPLLDLNYVEDSAGGPDVTVGFLPKLDKVTLLQVTSENLLLFILLSASYRWILSYQLTLENVMQLAIEGCKAIANYIREIMLENTKQLEYRRAKDCPQPISSINGAKPYGEWLRVGHRLAKELRGGKLTSPPQQNTEEVNNWARDQPQPTQEQ
ncbi:hypothetical protein CMV_001096 [Castanea mollissima]|uniref:Exoribonuclease phosphorolytic domain-containing protein n=1 Tax=Castanea mollissima TaxID=60419 RepID=A0A8J4S0D0_9ROSI|nr:hypothetical protein CMV_001096 [Castanea mollissima]